MRRRKKHKNKREKDALLGLIACVRSFFLSFGALSVMILALDHGEASKRSPTVRSHPRVRARLDDCVCYDDDDEASFGCSCLLVVYVRLF